jgi:hypothetical protein
VILPVAKNGTGGVDWDVGRATLDGRPCYLDVGTYKKEEPFVKIKEEWEKI